MKLILLPSVVVDVTGDTLLLLNRETSDVMAVSAEAVTYRAHPRAQIEIVEGGEILAEELRLRGFVSAVQPQDPVRVSRRSVVQGAAVVAGAGVVSLALPNAAFASSVVSLSGRWNWDVQAGDPPSRFDIYVSVAKSDIDLPGFDDSPWPPPMYYTIEVDLGGPKGTGGEYDGSGVTDVDWRWGAIGVANGDPGYDFLLPFHMGSPGTLEGVLKEAGKTIATLSLTYQA